MHRHSDVDGLSDVNRLCARRLRVVRSNASRRAPRGDEQPRWVVGVASSRSHPLSVIDPWPRSGQRGRLRESCSVFWRMANAVARSSRNGLVARPQPQTCLETPAVSCRCRRDERKNWKLSSHRLRHPAQIRIVIVGDPRDKSSALACFVVLRRGSSSSSLQLAAPTAPLAAKPFPAYPSGTRNASSPGSPGSQGTRVSCIAP